MSLIDAIIDTTFDPIMAEAVSRAYAAIFEGANEGSDNGVDISGSREPKMAMHGSVSDVGDGKHKVSMGAGSSGYSIDGTRIGWANPGGTFKSAIDAQNSFDASYEQKIASKMPSLPEADRKACAQVMGDHDGLWWFKYDNGHGYKRRMKRSTSEYSKLTKVTGTKGTDELDDLNDLIDKIANEYSNDANANSPNIDEVNKWLEAHGASLGDEKKNELRRMAIDRCNAYRKRREQMKAAIGDEITEQQFKEMTKTSQPFDNTPTDPQIIKNIAFMAGMLKKLREISGINISVNSCYRSPAVNSAVKGVKTSRHMRGMAMDLHTGSEADYRKLWSTLDACIQPWDIDQMIMYTRGNRIDTPIRFIHVGFSEPGQKVRHEKLWQNGNGHYSRI